MADEAGLEIRADMRCAYPKFLTPLAFALCFLFCGAWECGAANRIPDKTVVLTLDDAVKSQIEFVAPLLEQMGFKATFFISHA